MKRTRPPKGQGRTPDERRAFMREYMRQRRAGTLVRMNRSPTPRLRVNHLRPLYEHLRNAGVTYDCLGALVFGDPPIGRRAIDQVHEAAE
jgi:hypothetical protein